MLLGGDFLKYFSGANHSFRVEHLLIEPYVLNGVARWYPLQALHHNFAISGLPGAQFHTAIGTANGFYNPSQYNPGKIIQRLNLSSS